VLSLQAADMAAWYLFNATQQITGIKKANLLATEGYTDLRRYRESEDWYDCGYQTAEQLGEFVEQLSDSPIFAEVKELRVRKR
jgi:hypothetical protein